MIYTIEKSILISEQLRKFSDGFSHHLAGHYANVDFWLDEVIQALATIDEHRKRFERLKDAQIEWVQSHNTVSHKYCPICKGRCEFCDGKPSIPANKHRAELSEARRELIDSAYFFLLRCYKIGLLDENGLKEKCAEIGSGVDLSDLN